MRVGKRKSSVKLLKKTSKTVCHRNKDCGKHEEGTLQDYTKTGGSDDDYNPEDSTNTDGSENLDWRWWEFRGWHSWFREEAPLSGSIWEWGN